MNPEFENCVDCVEITTDDTPVTFPPLFTNPAEGDDGVTVPVTTTVTPTPVTLITPTTPIATPTTPSTTPVATPVTSTPTAPVTTATQPATTPTTPPVCQIITLFSTTSYQSTSTSILTRISNSKSTIITPSTSYLPVHSLVEITSGVRYGNTSRIDYSTRTIDSTLTITLYLADVIDVLITQLTTYYYIYPTQSVNSVTSTSCQMEPVITIPGTQTNVPLNTPTPTTIPTPPIPVSSTSIFSITPSVSASPPTTVTIINPCEANILRGRARKLHINYLLLLIGLII